MIWRKKLHHQSQDCVLGPCRKRERHRSCSQTDRQLISMIFRYIRLICFRMGLSRSNQTWWKKHKQNNKNKIQTYSLFMTSTDITNTHLKYKSKKKLILIGCQSNIVLLYCYSCGVDAIILVTKCRKTSNFSYCERVFKMLYSCVSLWFSWQNIENKNISSGHKNMACGKETRPPPSVS